METHLDPLVWLRLHASKIKELRSYMLCDVAKKTRKHNARFNDLHHTNSYSFRNKVFYFLHKKHTFIIPLPNSMKLWAMPCRSTQDGRIMVESSDKMWSTGEGNSKTLQYSCLENPHEQCLKRQKDMTLKDELPRLVGAQYATGEITPERMKRLSQSKKCSGSWWWTGKPGVLQSMGSQRVGHDWETELNWYDMYIFFSLSDLLHSMK